MFIASLIIFTLDSDITSWTLVIQFIFTLVMALKCNHFQP
ncbi:hypothetical protein [Brumicola pallidula]